MSRTSFLRSVSACQSLGWRAWGCDVEPSSECCAERLWLLHVSPVGGTFAGPRDASGLGPVPGTGTSSTRAVVFRCFRCSFLLPDLILKTSQDLTVVCMVVMCELFGSYLTPEPLQNRPRTAGTAFSQATPCSPVGRAPTQLGFWSGCCLSWKAVAGGRIRAGPSTRLCPHALPSAVVTSLLFLQVPPYPEVFQDSLHTYKLNEQGTDVRAADCFLCPSGPAAAPHSHSPRGGFSCAPLIRCGPSHVWSLSRLPAETARSARASPSPSHPHCSPYLASWLRVSLLSARPSSIAVAHAYFRHTGLW